MTEPRQFVAPGIFQATVCGTCFSTRFVFVGSESSGRVSIRDQEVEFLIGTAAGKKETDTAGVFQHHGTDLEEFQADGTVIRAGQFSAFQGDQPDRLDQGVGQRGQ